MALPSERENERQEDSTRRQKRKEIMVEITCIQKTFLPGIFKGNVTASSEGRNKDLVKPVILFGDPLPDIIRVSVATIVCR
jgi:hypothetical protein